MHSFTFLVAAFCSALVFTGHAQATPNLAKKSVGFVSVPSGAPGVEWSSVDWGDYDNDGDLDYAIVGQTFALDAVSAIYRNDSGSFTDIGATLVGGAQSTTEWGDYDSDGDLDLLVMGAGGSKIYRNDAGVFNDSGNALPSLFTSAADFGDYDNDGDLDLLLAGDANLTVTGMGVALYRNDNGSFTNAEYWIGMRFRTGSVEWGDYDSDGDLDFAVAGLVYGGSGGCCIAESHIVRNDGGGAFAWLPLALPGAYSADWSDFDNDGDLDLLLTGIVSNDEPNFSAIYRNDAGSFVNSGQGGAGVWLGASAWGDFDNNGYQDLIITGTDISVDETDVRTNTAGILSYFSAPFPNVSTGDVAWGDYDNDHDLDLLITGITTGFGTYARLYSNTSTVPNTLPTAPTDLSAVRVGNQVTFSWTASTDAETASAGLSYNLRVGTTPDGVDICPPNSSPLTGHRSIAARGNVGAGTSWTLTIPSSQQFFWAVQAVDAAFEGSSFAPEQSSGPSFTEVATGMLGLWDMDADWGDYDNDGDLDLLLAGYALSTSSFATRIYRNDAGSFTDIAANLVGLAGGSARWGDYDNDADLDLLLTGYDGSSGVTKVYRNDAGSFVDVPTGLLAVQRGSASWGDYDNDGDLDILLLGLDLVSTQWVSRVYRNDAGQFNQFIALTPGLFDSACDWGDYDGDGDLDILLVGIDAFTETGLVLRNDGGSFVDAGAGLPGGWRGAVDWGDYDNDGDLDLVITGRDASGFVSSIYRNDAGSFTDVGAGLTGLDFSSAAWGDYDNDGDLDVLMNGSDDTLTEHTLIVRNMGSSFEVVLPGFANLSKGAARWVDYDGDGDLDALICGIGAATAQTHLYRNESSVANTPPTTPTFLASARSENTVTFSWVSSQDAQTPQAGLNYNLRVGTTPGGSDVASAMSASSDGYRQVVRRGNAGQATTWSLDLPTDTYYYWSVQAIDGAFAGSLFHAEQRVDPLFADTQMGLRGVFAGALDWGDWDNDGDLDLVVAGQDAASVPSARIYRNDTGSFVDIGAGLPGLLEPSVNWGDYDNDDDLDLLLTGGFVARIYRNDGAGSFADIGAGLVGVNRGMADWGDFDNDGDLDLAVFGGFPRTGRIYRNDQGSFTDLSAGLPGASDGDVEWGDFDGDGDLDLALLGLDVNGQGMAKVFRNDNAVLTDIGSVLAPFTPLAFGSVAWGDVDRDGRLDLLLSGSDDSLQPYTEIYRNIGGGFSLLRTLSGVHDGVSRWGDYDNDGDLDVLQAGGGLARVQRNDGPTFVSLTSGLYPVQFAAAAWGDYDHNGTLDAVIMGLEGTTTVTTRLYQNNTTAPHPNPDPPRNLSSRVVSPNLVEFSWSPPLLPPRIPNDYSYNLFISTSSGSDLYPAMADLSRGTRRLAREGSIRSLSLTLSIDTLGPIEWGVQTVDHGFMGSRFTAASEVVTSVDDPPTPYRLSLAQNVPNPFNPRTTILFELPHTTDCELAIYDVAGRHVRTLIRGTIQAGPHSLTWEGRDDRGRGVASGTYIYRLRSEDRVIMKRMILLK